jgi:hypothetical protein
MFFGAYTLGFMRRIFLLPETLQAQTNSGGTIAPPPILAPKAP